MNMNNYIKKRRSLFIITGILIIAIISISIYVYNDKNKETTSIQEQDLSISYNISKDQSSPMDATNGITNAPLSTIKIKNNKSYQQKYQLIISSDEKSTLELNKVYIYINGDVKTLQDFNNNNYTDTIKSNEEKIISFKIWVGSDLINQEDEDKVVSLKYDIKKQD